MFHMPCTPADLNRLKDALTSKRWDWVFIQQDKCPLTVGDLLRSTLHHILPANWPLREKWGGMYLNGKPCTLASIPLAPCTIEYYEPKFDLNSPEKFFGGFNKNLIVYEDDFFIVVYKTNYLPSMPVREQRHYNLKHLVETYLQQTVHMPSRLDMSTQGLVAISKATECHNALQRLFERRLIEKSYLLHTNNLVSWRSLQINAPIGRHPLHPALRALSCAATSKSATTDFSLVATSIANNTSLILAKPHTGRTHQIRVHSSTFGFSITGDNFYGGASASELYLLSYRLRFTHPITKAAIDLTVPAHLLPSWANSALQQAELSTLALAGQ